MLTNPPKNSINECFEKIHQVEKWNSGSPTDWCTAHIPNITVKAKISSITPKKIVLPVNRLSAGLYPTEKQENILSLLYQTPREKKMRIESWHMSYCERLPHSDELPIGWYTIKIFHMYLPALRNRPILRHPSPELGTICVLGSDLNLSQRIQKAWFK